MGCVTANVFYWAAFASVWCFFAGVLSVVTGSGPTLGEVLTRDERVRTISFTGSTEVGRKLIAQ